jgi:hypothetical protein
MRKWLAVTLLALLGACVGGDIPVPPSGPGRQNAICAIAFAQWLGINSHEVEILGRSAKGANAVVALRATEPRVRAACEITPDYALASLVVE